MRRLVVYGPVTGFSSYPVVLKGLIRGLVANGLALQVIDTTGPAANHGNGELDDLQGVEWLDGLQWDIANAGSAAEVLDGVGAVLVLNPHPEVVARLTEAGIAAVGLHVGDVDEVPADWTEAIRGEWLTVVPSTWLARVVERAAAREVLVVPHGVGRVFCRHGTGVRPWSPPRVLHTCSAIYFPERKGTPQVLEALELLDAVDLALTLLVPRKSRAIGKLLDDMPPLAWAKVRLVEQPEGLPATSVRELYLDHDLLLCPSRAEGFGMQALEARACGVPVVQTACTGLAMHFARSGARPGVRQVPSGPMAPAWAGFGQAPQVRADRVAGVLRAALRDIEQLKVEAWQAAPQVAKEWAWPRVVAPLAERLKGVLS